MKNTIFTFLIIFTMALSGCMANDTENTQAAPERKLKLSAVIDKEADFTAFHKDDLDGKTKGDLIYLDVTNVRVQIDGNDTLLEDAVRSSKITTAEIFAYARMDAQNGICQEKYTSDHGVTIFRYIYPEFELNITYDVFETPDGKQTLIEELIISSLENHDLAHYYVDESSEYGYFLDREDWGLTFTVSSVSPSRITVDYTQCQGQEVGELTLESYMLYSIQEDGTSDYLARSWQDTEGLPAAIQSDGTGQFTLDWSATAGTLEPGEYYLSISVTDNYDEADLHPLMVNYYDTQSYHIVFTVE